MLYSRKADLGKSLLLPPSESALIKASEENCLVLAQPLKPICSELLGDLRERIHEKHFEPF